MLPLAWRPYAKAIKPALFTLVAVVAHWIVTGELGRAELAAAFTGGASALITLLTSNAARVHVEDSEDSPDVEQPDLRGRSVEGEGLSL